MFDGSSIQGFARIQESTCSCGPPESHSDSDLDAQRFLRARIICDVHARTAAPTKVIRGYALKRRRRPRRKMANVQQRPELESSVPNEAARQSRTTSAATSTLAGRRGARVRSESLNLLDLRITSS